jgi:hypothetical protein
MSLEALFAPCFAPSNARMLKPGDETCDYDENCTYLFKTIESEEWDVVASFMDTGYWPMSIYQDALIPEEQARIMVQKRQLKEGEEGEGSIVWSQLPLHLAIVCNAPIGIIRRLFDAYPEGINITDDEHMLPLHLALRHGSPDNIVDYLLQAYPEAVNIRGKNGRNVIDIAMRSSLKARARILSIFIDKIAKGANDDKKIKDLLNEKDVMLNDLEDTLTVLEDEREIVEGDIQKKLKELDRTRSLLQKRLVELKDATTNAELRGTLSADHQNKRTPSDLENEEQQIQTLLSCKTELEETEKRLAGEEAGLNKDLENIQVCIAMSFEKNQDLDHLKGDVESLQARRLVHAKESTKIEVELLKKGLDPSDKEITKIRERLLELEVKSAEAASHEDLIKVRAEILRLKEELALKQDKLKMKGELLILRRSLEAEQKLAGDSLDEAGQSLLADTITAMETPALEKMTLEELAGLKIKANETKDMVVSQILVSQTQHDLADIKVTVAENLKSAGDKKLLNRKEKKEREVLVKMSEKLGAISVEAIQELSKEDILRLRLEMAIMKKELGRKETVASLKEKLALMSHEVQTIARNSTGKAKRDLSAHLKAVNKMKNSRFDSKTVDDLTRMEKELIKIEEQVNTNLEADKAKLEITKMRTMITKQLRDSDSKTKAVILTLKDELDVIESRKSWKKSQDKIDAVKAGLEDVTVKMAMTEAQNKTKNELASLKKEIAISLERVKSELKPALRELQHNVAAIDLDNVEAEDADEWRALQSELESLKTDLKRKELLHLKQNLLDQLADGKKKKNSQAIRTAIDRITPEVVAKANAAELDQLKDDVEKCLEAGKKWSFFSSPKPSTSKPKAVVPAVSKHPIVKAAQHDPKTSDAVRVVSLAEGSFPEGGGQIDIKPPKSLEGGTKVANQAKNAKTVALSIPENVTANSAGLVSTLSQ